MISYPVVRKHICYAALILSLGGGAAFAEKNAAIADAARLQVEAAVETISELASIESPSNHAEGLAQVAAILEGRLTDLGFDTHRETSPTDVNADTVVGVKLGTGTQKVMLIAHMDTVFDVGTLELAPVRLDGDRLYGPGVVDNKGGIAIILHSLQVLNDFGWTDYASLTVLFNPDEEIGTAGSGPVIARISAEMDTALSFEVGGSPKDGWGWIILGAMGSADVTMTVTGLASHAGEPDKGRNAVLELAHQVLATKDIVGDMKGIYFNWTIVGSDNASNQIPDKAVATADVRIAIEGAEVKLLEALRAKVAESTLIKGTETTVSLRVRNPMFLANTNGYRVAKMVQDIYAEVSPLILYLVPLSRGVSHMGYVSKAENLAAVEGLGPSGEALHSLSEYLDIGSLEPAIYRTVRLLMELGAPSEP